MELLAGDIGDILGSPAWTAAATLLALATILLTIYLYRRGRSRKSLTFRQKATQLVSIHDEARGKIAISYEGQLVEQVFLIEVHLKNSGNVPILQSDFDEPLRLDLGKATAMTVNLAEAKPSGLSPKFEIEDHRVSVAPLLLNPGDELTFKILLQDYEHEPRLSYRIVGISELIDAREQEQRREKWRWLTTGDLFLSIGVALAVATALSAVTSGSFLGADDQGKDTGTLITLRPPEAKQFCGHIRHLDDKKMVIREADSGHIIILPVAKVVGFKENSC